ncbi:uncharacterized protein VP01_50g3 [Puccinia sorghi]|uniref:Uncharacterized protein n=1 Tax=Puccinia sorghi TaxID=27349 RepID=A0A0L6ULA1_9BASI|nr:uncharacterized protein VP01_50g3 [Puccinia sorghi]
MIRVLIFPVKKDSIAVAIESLVGFLNSQTNKLEAQRSSSQPAASNADDKKKKTNIQQEMVLYQEVHAPHASKEDSLAQSRFSVTISTLRFSPA